MVESPRPDRSKGRDRRKSSSWCSRLAVGRETNDPTPEKFTEPWRRPRPTQGCSASKAENDYDSVLVVTIIECSRYLSVSFERNFSLFQFIFYKPWSHKTWAHCRSILRGLTGSAAHWMRWEDNHVQWSENGGELTVLACFKVLSQPLFCKTEWDEDPRWGQPVPQPSLECGTFPIQFKCITADLICSVNLMTLGSCLHGQ
jgi:hypothetical protein